MSQTIAEAAQSAHGRSAEREMKPYKAIIAILIAGNALAGNVQPNGPAQTPEELGKRVAHALIAADMTSAGILLPSYEAYLPVCRINLGETPATEENLQACYSRWMGRLKEEIQRFPSEFTKATTFRADQIDGVDVTLRQDGAPTNWANVDIMFKVKDAKFKMTLKGCIGFKNSWYLTDFEWAGRGMAQNEASQGTAR